jgi:hypothetical protein
MRRKMKGRNNTFVTRKKNNVLNILHILEKKLKKVGFLMIARLIFGYKLNPYLMIFILKKKNIKNIDQKSNGSKKVIQTLFIFIE